MEHLSSRWPQSEKSRSDAMGLTVLFSNVEEHRGADVSLVCVVEMKPDIL
jgi:hypothetical protein